MTEESPNVDYRFLLANERTFLAWIRTALGLIAGGVALDQFVRVEQGEALVVAVALLTIGAGALLAVVGTVRWVRIDDAMRAGRPLERSRVIVVVGILTAVLALLVALILAVT
jgi:putative membrane protein